MKHHTTTRFPGSLLNSVMLGLLLLAMGSPLNAQEAGNLIQNGDFEAGSNGWFYNPQSLQFVEENGNYYILVDQINQPTRVIDQLLPQFPIGPDVPGVGFRADVAIDSLSPATLEAIRMEVHLFLQNFNFQIEHIPFDNPNIPNDGGFHPVQGFLPFPQGFLTNNGVQEVYFAITKFENGAICIDNIELFVGDPPPNVVVTLMNNRGPLRGGTRFKAMGSGVEVFRFAQIGGRGALLVNSEEGELTFESSPGLNPGPQPFLLIDEQGNFVIAEDNFHYAPDPFVRNIDPCFVNPAGQQTIMIHGEHFRPELGVTLGDQPVSQNSITILDEQTIEVDLSQNEPLDPGAHTIGVVDEDGGIFNSPRHLVVGSPTRITGITPSTGSTRGGGIFHLEGSNLDHPGTRVIINDQSPVGIQRQSDTLLTGILPPGESGPATVDLFVGNSHVDSVDGLLNLSSQPLPGDINEDGQVTIGDYVLLQQSLPPGGDPSGLDLGTGDVNGDGIIDILDGTAIFNSASNPIQLGNPDPESPSLIIGTCNSVFEDGVKVNAEIDITVQGIGSSVPARIELGNGFAHEISGDGTYSFAFDDVGMHTVSLITVNGRVASETIEVVPENPVQISSINLSLGDTGDRVLQLEEGNEPPDLVATMELEGAGIVNLAVHHDSDMENADITVLATVMVPEEPAGQKTIVANLGPAILTPGTQHTVSVGVHSGADTTTPEAANPFPSSIQITGFVTPGDCAEILRNWRDLVAQKEAKKADCEALQKQLDDLKEDLANKEAQKPVKEQDIADCKEARDDLQSEIDRILDFMNAFMPPGATAQTFMDGGDFPPGSQYAGTTSNGSSTGVGISFSDGNDALGAIENYEDATGRNFGEDMAEMRENIRDIETFNTQIQNKEADLNNLNNEINDLKNNKIPAKEQELADCKAACDTLETQIANYADAHKNCLEQIEKQRKSQAAINDASRQGTRAQNQANQTGRSAEGAQNAIDTRSGSPGQIAEDESDVATANACKDQAQSLINQGNNLLRQAREALRGGDTEMADDFTAQAKVKFDQAKAKLDDADEHIRDARTRALGRKRRDCPVECEGLARITEERYCVFNSLDDVSIVLYGYTPEKWASFDAAAREAIDGLDKVNEIADAGGTFSPIGTATVSDVGDVATAIYNAFANNLAGSVAGWSVWIKHSGYVMIKRTTIRCVNGCWVNEGVEEIRTEETCAESKRLPGRLVRQSGDLEPQLQDILNRYRNSLRPKRLSPPVTTKEQPQ